jgi:hypothetical protein
MGSQPGQRDPAFQRILIGGILVGEMIGAVQPCKAQLLYRSCYSLPTRPVQTVLAFQKDSDFDQNDYP